MRSQLENPGSGGERGRLKPRRAKRSNLPPQEPSVIEPDRPAHRPRPAAELLGGAPERNDTTTSLSSYLVGTADPGEDYFPYPNGGGDEPGFDKQFMLEPNWYEQFQSRSPSPSAETPPLPGASVDGHSTLYQRVPTTEVKTDALRNMVMRAERPGNPVNFAGAATSGGDPDLQRRINELYSKIDQLEIGRSESNHIEIILFVMTGIFVLLLLDLLLKQGARAIGSIAAAAAGVPMQRMGGGNGGYGGAGFNHPFFF